MRATRAAAAFVVAAFTIACSAAVPPAPATVAPHSPAPASVTTTQAPSIPASGDPQQVFVDELHELPDLEAALPESIAGVAMMRTSFASSQEVADDEVFGDALQRLGRSGADVQIAVAVPNEIDEPLYVVAMRVPGMTGKDLKALVDAEFTADYAASTVAGKSVLGSTSDDGTTTYILVGNEAVYFIDGASDLTEAAIGAID